MRAPSSPVETAVAAALDKGIPLHAIWYSVLRPHVIVKPGQSPGFEPVSGHTTLAEATGHVRNIPGGAIALNVIVFVNPQGALPGPLRQQ